MGFMVRCLQNVGHMVYVQIYINVKVLYFSYKINSHLLFSGVRRDVQHIPDKQQNPLNQQVIFLLPLFPILIENKRYKKRQIVHVFNPCIQNQKLADCFTKPFQFILFGRWEISDACTYIRLALTGLHSPTLTSCSRLYSFSLRTVNTFSLANA